MEWLRNQYMFNLFRFFKEAIIYHDDRFAYYWHNLNQLYEVFTGNVFELLFNVLVSNSCVESIVGMQ